MDYRTAAKTAINAAFNELKSSDGHNDCVNKVYNKLLSVGYKVEKEKELKLKNGHLAKPDLTIVDSGGRNMCHIEIKCKNHIDQQDLEQVQKSKEAEDGKVPVVLANMNPSKDAANIRDA